MVEAVGDLEKLSFDLVDELGFERFMNGCDHKAKVETGALGAVVVTQFVFEVGKKGVLLEELL